MHKELRQCTRTSLMEDLTIIPAFAGQLWLWMCSKAEKCLKNYSTITAGGSR